MIETGHLNSGEIRNAAQGPTLQPATPTVVRGGLRKRLCAGVAACVFTLSLVAPVSIDLATGEIAPNAALAGNGDGNYGKGKGNGGANGDNPGKGNGRGGGDDDDDDDDDHDGDDDDDDDNNNDDDDNNNDDDQDDGTDDGDAVGPTIPVTEEDGDRGSGADAAAGMADADFAETIDAVAGAPAEGPMAAPAAPALPTISQLFSMGDEAAVTAENELELIANGWNTPN